MARGSFRARSLGRAAGEHDGGVAAGSGFAGHVPSRDGQGARRRPAHMKLKKLGGLALGAMLVAAACNTGGGATAAPGATEGPTQAPAEVTPPTDPLGVVTIAPGDPIHLAFWGVLSTADATLGEDALYGVQIAIDDKGGKLLDHTIQLTTEDGLCTVEGGATAAQKMAADSTLVGLIGSSCSDETIGGSKAPREAGLTTISP